MRQIKYAFRTLFKTPFVTTVAVLSLALGIGANSAIFSLFDQMLLQPLPVPHPDELVNLGAPGPKPGSQSCSQAGDCDVVFSYPMFRDLEKSQTVLTGLAAHVGFGANLSYKNQPVTADAMLVSGSYFPTLELHPATGRLLDQSDDQGIGGNFVTVLGYDFWKAKLGGDPSVVGQQILVNGKSLTIVGIAPKGFDGTTLGTQPAVYVPISMRAQMIQGWIGFERRDSYWAYLFGRRKPGVSIAQVRSALNTLYAPIINDIEAPLQKGMSDKRLAEFREKKILVEPGAMGQSYMHTKSKTPLWMLFGVTLTVLLIACANIANLLLARGASRSGEMGVRLALGATRARLMTQLLIESVLLALMGGVASLVVAQWTLNGIAALLPSEVSQTMSFTLQPAVVLFAAAVSVGTGLLFGMFPALHSTRSDLVTTIRSNTGQMSTHRGAARFRATLVTVQIALATALLVSAGLFLKSLANVSHVDLGVKIDNIATFGISPDRSGYDTLRAAGLFERVQQEFASTPGVTGVTASLVPLLAGSNWGTDVRVQGFAEGPDIDNNSRYNEVGDGYFGVLGVSLLAGRDFTLADRVGSGKVAIVNQAFAKKFNLGKDVVGKYMSTNTGHGGPLDIQIIGLVPDIKYSEVKDTVPPVFYTPWRQDAGVGSMSFYIRTPAPSSAILHTIPEVMKRIDAGIPVEDLRTMPEQITQNISLDRMLSILAAAFAALATLLAGVGLYGVLSYTVAQRTREIGVRMALGADARRVRVMVLRQVGAMMAIGGVIGAAVALGIGRAAASLLYGLKGHDPVVFALSIVVLALVAGAAGYVPALRASQVDPMHALRYE
ncbi:MAG TPA: ABC transporter permease [Gemmatimonadales bacterium]|nr:ABC transporter permease [Gemmatimonadales bacterium]